MDTANLINIHAKLDLEIQISNLIKERNGGVLEGKSYANESKYIEDIDASWYGTFVPEDAESWE